MPKAGDISVRFSVQDQEAVRKALEQLGADGQAALKKIDAAGQQPGQGLKALDQVMSDLRSRFVGLAVPLGGIGQGLIALGPVGLTVAAAIGAVATAISFASEKATEFAEKSKLAKEAAETAGLSLTQWKLLGQQGVKVGLDADQTAAFVNRLTVSIQELQSKGSGPLFDALLKLDSGLLQQIASTRDTGQALDLLSAAFARLDDQFKRNEFVAAIAGKRNLGGGRLLESIAGAGGLGSLEADARAAGKSVDENLTAKVVQLKIEIDEIKKRTNNIWGRAFAEDVLQAQRNSASNWEKIAGFAERAYNASKGMAADVLKSVLGLVSGSSGSGAQSVDESGFLMSGGNVPLPQRRPAGANVPPPVPPAVQLQMMQRWTSVLGDAISPTEALKQKILELNVAQDRGGVSDQVRARALAAFQLAQERTVTSVRTQIGIASEEEIIAVRLRDLQEQRAKGYIKSDDEMATAERIMRKEVLQTSEALKIRASDTPALTKLAQDSSKLSLNLDQELASALRSSTSDMIAMARGTETLGQGFSNLAIKLTDAITQAILLKTVINPAAKGLSSALEGMFSGGGGASTGGANSLAFWAANGAAFEGGRPVHPFALGGVVNRPTFFPFASGIGLMGEAGPEAIMPLRKLASGRLGVEAAGSRASVNINFAPVINASGGSRDEIDAALRLAEARFKSQIVPVVRDAVSRGAL